MKRTFAIILLLASVARADVGAIDSNAPLPQTPTRYVVVALPQGWQQDEESLSLLRLKQEPIEGASTYFFWPENPNW